jgi:hypothetical protein
MESRCGKPVATRDGISAPGEQAIERDYAFHGMLVTVVYLGGRSVTELYRKQDGTRLSNDETEVLLKANTLGSKWEEEPSFDSGKFRKWKLQNKKGQAMWVKSYLSIASSN